PVVAAAPAPAPLAIDPAPRRKLDSLEIAQLPIADTPEDLAQMLDELDAGFQAAVTPEGQPSPTKAPQLEDMSAPRELFEKLAFGYVRPIRSFMMELAWNDAPQGWVDVCLPTAKAVRGS